MTEQSSDQFDNWRARMPRVADRLDDLWALYEALKEEVDDCWHRADGKRSEVPFRIAVRSTFVLIEGMTYALKQFVLEWLRAQHGLSAWGALTPEELGRLALLAEEDYELDDKGRVRVGDERLNSAANLLFAFNAFQQVVNKNASPIDKSGQGWQEYVKAIKIRNRLTHPKTPSELRVSEDDVLLVNRVYNWFHAQFTSAFRT